MLNIPLTRKTTLPTALLLLFLLGTGVFFSLTGKEIYWPGYLSMILFYGLVFFIGSLAAEKRSLSDPDELILAGRSMPLVLAIFTMSATWVGGGYINGTAEATASSGLLWVQAPWGYALSLIVGGLFFAGKMRRHNYKTMLDPIQQRFGKRMTGLLFLPAVTGEIFWTAAILTALGTTFGIVLGLSFSSSIILSAFIAIAYTAIGGLWAVAMTDCIQLVLLLVGLCVALPFAFGQTGGVGAVWTEYKAVMGESASVLPPLPGLNWQADSLLWWDSMLLLIFGGLAWQVYFQRVLAAKDVRTAKRLSVLAGVICALAAVPAVFIGLIGRTADWAALGIEPPENYAVILPYVIRYLTNPMISVVGLGAIAAAVMSSVDSSILSASTLAGWNVYRPLVAPDLSGEQMSKVIRRCIFIIGATATLLALRAKSVYALWYLCSDFVYCILFPQLVAALFFKSANRWGSLAGFVLTLLLRLGQGEASFGIPVFLPLPGMAKTAIVVIGLGVIRGVSLATAKICPPEELKVLEE